MNHYSLSQNVKSETLSLDDSGYRKCVHIGNCMEVLDDMIRDGRMFDAIITDPPYEIGYMGKQWDDTGISFMPSTWQKITKVLKPGGFIAVFASPRLYHHLAVAIEKTGVETYPFLTWEYDTGLPKPMNVAKLFDRDNCKNRTPVGWRRVSGYSKIQMENGQQKYTNFDQPIYDHAVSEEAQEWDGYFYGVNTMKPASEPIYIGRKPISEKRVIDNIREHGVGALNIDALKQRYGGKWPSTRLRHAKTSKRNHQTDHLTVKPISLMEDLVALTCPSGGHVLDPFAGTGTTGAACKKLGMKFTLIEQDERWLDAIMKRTA